MSPSWEGELPRGGKGKLVQDSGVPEPGSSLWMRSFPENSKSGQSLASGRVTDSLGQSERPEQEEPPGVFSAELENRKHSKPFHTLTRSSGHCINLIHSKTVLMSVTSNRIPDLSS